MDGRPKLRNKAAFSNFSGEVWTGPSAGVLNGNKTFAIHSRMNLNPYYNILRFHTLNITYFIGISFLLRQKFSDVLTSKE